jgi:hypothetical protein
VQAGGCHVHRWRRRLSRWAAVICAAFPSVAIAQSKKTHSREGRAVKAKRLRQRQQGRVRGMQAEVDRLGDRRRVEALGDPPFIDPAGSEGKVESAGVAPRWRSQPRTAPNPVELLAMCY